MIHHRILKKQMFTIFSAIIAYIISLIPLHLTSFYLTIGFIPIVILGVNYGAKYSLTASLLWGFLTIITGQAETLTTWQVFIEYIIAFTCGGLCGIYNFRNHKKTKSTLIISLSIGVICRYFWHFIAGVMFWKQFMPAKINPYLYSFITNSLSALLTIIADGLVLILIYKFQPTLFKQNTN